MLSRGRDRCAASGQSGRDRCSFSHIRPARPIHGQTNRMNASSPTAKLPDRARVRSENVRRLRQIPNLDDHPGLARHGDQFPRGEAACRQRLRRVGDQRRSRRRWKRGGPNGPQPAQSSGLPQGSFRHAYPSPNHVRPWVGEGGRAGKRSQDRSPVLTRRRQHAIGPGRPRPSPYEPASARVATAPIGSARAIASRSPGPTSL